MSVVACFRALGYLSFGLLFGVCIGNNFPFGVTLPFFILTLITLSGVLVAHFGLDNRINKRVMESEPLLERED